MTDNKKYTVIKYSFLVSSLIFSVLMFFKWFEISYLSNSETHSFLTLPGLVADTIETFKSYTGNAASFTILLLAGSLEYFCIISAALGIWGIIRTLMKKRRSRLLLASQITSLILIAIAIIAIIIIDVISGSMLGDLVAISPTLWLLLSLLSLIVSIIMGFYYNRFNGVVDSQEDEQTEN